MWVVMMNRKLVIRGAAISVSAIAASVFVAGQYLGENQSLTSAGSVSGMVTEIRGASLVGAPVQPAQQDIATAAPQFSALDIGAETMGGPVIQNDIQPALVFADQGLPQDSVGCSADVVAEPSVDGLISLRLTAPCNPNERVVISHGDLAFSATLDAAGAFSAYIPALSTPAKVDVFLSDDTYLQAETVVPEYGSYARMIVQWTGSDSLALHAFHRGAAYGEDGHIHARNPFDPDLEEAFLVALGDPTGVEPMLAQVYSIPLAQADIASVQLEVAANAETCGKDLSAFVMPTHGTGAGHVEELSIAMPDCGAGDGFVILDLGFDPVTPAAEALEFTSDQS